MPGRQNRDQTLSDSRVYHHRRSCQNLVVKNDLEHELLWDALHFLEAQKVDFYLVRVEQLGVHQVVGKNYGLLRNIQQVYA